MATSWQPVAMLWNPPAMPQEAMEMSWVVMATPWQPMAMPWKPHDKVMATHGNAVVMTRKPTPIHCHVGGPAQARARFGAGAKGERPGWASLGVPLKIERLTGVGVHIESLVSRSRRGRDRCCRGCWRSLAGRGGLGRTGVAAYAPLRCLVVEGRGNHA